jgi:lipoic acid synthetase
MRLLGGKPNWLKVPALGGRRAAEVRRILNRHGLDTVCNQAKCPNRGHCYDRGTATFMLMGDRCTRNCLYCAVRPADGSLPPPDPGEPRRLAEACRDLGLSYVVLTSVTRDDLEDGGAGHFAAAARTIADEIPSARVELLVPDFEGRTESLRAIAESPIDVFNHNLETVERMFSVVRPQASYRRSLEVLRAFGSLRPEIPLKSGLMLGLGETDGDVERALDDLRDVGVDMLTLGQYLRPSLNHYPVDRYVTPSEFDGWRSRAMDLGFGTVASGPLVRSSYHADLSFQEGHGERS